jgi:hypothetical protein
LKGEDDNSIYGDSLQVQLEVPWLWYCSTEVAESINRRDLDCNKDFVGLSRIIDDRDYSPCGNCSCQSRVELLLREKSSSDSILIYRYLLHIKSQPAPDDDAAEGNTKQGEGYRRPDDRDQSRGGPARKKLSKEEKKAQRGANKGRRFGKIRDELELCWRIADGSICEFGDEFVGPSIKLPLR